MLGRLIAIAGLLCSAVPAYASSEFDYVATVHGWNIEGWTDSSQISCGAATAPDITERGYVSIYRQVWGPAALWDSNGPLSFWDMDLGTTLPTDTAISLTFDIDDKLHAVYPGDVSVARTANPQRNVISLDTESCALSPNCAEAPGNMLMSAIAAELDNSKSLVITAKYNGGQEVHRVNVSEFGAASKAIKECFDTLNPRLSQPLQ